MLHSAVVPSIPFEPLHIPGTLATRYDGVHARHGSADKRSQHQTPKEEDESNERDTHQSMRFTVRLGILQHKNGVSTRHESQRRRTH